MTFKFNYSIDMSRRLVTSVEQFQHVIITERGKLSQRFIDNAINEWRVAG